MQRRAARSVSRQQAVYLQQRMRSAITIVSTVLGKEWLGKDLFRLGVSRLGNSLMSAVEQKTVNYF